jgi:hypothetical protein
MGYTWMKQAIAGLLSATMLLWAAAAFAQGSGTCTLTGTVYDSSGAVVPGAKVQLTQKATSVSRETIANGSGFFSFIGIPAGIYDVKVEAKGFAAFTQAGIPLHINDQIDLKQIALKVAGGAATVEVTAAPAEVIPESSGDVSYTLTSKQVDNLAIVGRNAVELLKILPGAQNSGGWNGTYSGETAGFNGGAGAYTVNGTRFDQMAVVSDGGNVIDHGFNGGAMVTPNVEMIQEAKVETASYSAENPNGPIVMSTVTKSGGKNFHGEAYYSIRDGSMNANDWWNNNQGVARPASRYQYPGFNIGGPVIIPGTNFNKNRDKLFFFAGFEWMRQGVDLGLKRTVVPTAAMRTGDFSDTTYLGNLLAGGIVGTKICEGSPLPGYCASMDKISQSAIDPGGQILLNLYHLPNADPATHNGFNYLTDIVNQQPRAQQLVKIDYAVTASTHLSGRYNHEGETDPYPYGLWQTWPTNPYPGNVVTSNQSHSIALNLTRAFSSTFTNELTFTANHLFYGSHLSNTDAVSASKLGYPYYGVYNNGLNVIPNVDGDVASTGIADLYNEGGVIPNQNTPKWTYTLSENVSKVLRTHLMRAGFYWSRETWQQRTGDNAYLDQGAITLASWNTLTGNGYADLLMGHISMFSQGLNSVQLSFAANEYDFYAQDTWKIGRRLSLDYGVRLDHIGWWYNQQGNIAVFNPSKYDSTAGIAAYSGIMTHANDSSVPRSGYKPVGVQFLPSIGFSWDMTGSGKTVVRGGFGMNMFRDEGITAAFKLVQNPPLQRMDYFSAWPGPYLADLSSIIPSATPPWLNTAIPTESKMPRTYSYNLTVQRQIPGSTLISAAYVGNVSQHLVGWPDSNPVPQGAELGVDWPGNDATFDAPYRTYHNVAGIFGAAHVLKSNYNSLQVTASRGKGAINYWLNYTFSKGLGNNSADSFDNSRTYGPLPWDRSQALKIAYNISLPAFSSKYFGGHAVGNAVLDGWQVSGITEFDSGAPLFTVGPSFPGGIAIGMTNTNTGTAAWRLTSRYINGTPDETIVPLLTCDPTAHLAPHQIFNAACFQAPSHGNNGTYRLPYIHGPWTNNSDLSIFKNFKMSESRNLQFRAEAFNFLNHPLWTFVCNDPALQLQIADFGAQPTNASTAGIMTNKHGHRIMQLALKFYF